MSDLNASLMICEQIAVSGSTPSVALLRAKSPQKLSLPEAIKIVKNYHSGARSTSENAQSVKLSKEPIPLSIEKRLDILEQENQQLKQQLALLETKYLEIVRKE